METNKRINHPNVWSILVLCSIVVIFCFFGWLRDVPMIDIKSVAIVLIFIVSSVLYVVFNWRKW